VRSETLTYTAALQVFVQLMINDICSYDQSQLPQFGKPVFVFLNL